MTSGLVVELGGNTCPPVKAPDGTTVKDRQFWRNTTTGDLFQNQCGQLVLIESCDVKRRPLPGSTLSQRGTHHKISGT